MKKTSKIEKIYKEKFQELLKHNRAYFEKDSPIISDSEFDELKKEILKLEDKHPSLKNLGGVETAIGYKPSTKFEKIKLLSSKITSMRLANEIQLVRNRVFKIAGKVRGYISLEKS